MLEKIIIAGFGGQGVLLMGKLLAMAGASTGKNATWLPAYGPEKRGGFANCSVIISDEKIASPFVTKATSAIIMNDAAFDQYEDYVIPGGSLFINSSNVTKKSSREDINIYYIPSVDIANEVGSSKTANIVMMGAFLEKIKCVTNDAVLEALLESLGQGKEKLIPINKNAMEKGAQAV